MCCDMKDSKSSCQCDRNDCCQGEIQETRFVPAPAWFGLKKTYTLIRCCGKATLRYQEIETSTCADCGKEFIFRKHDVCVCPVCGEYDYYAAIITSCG